MMFARYFQIPPDNPEVMVKLVESVSDEWGWVDGFLAAPTHLILSDEAIENTGIVLNRFHSINPMIQPRWTQQGGPQIKPDLFAILAERKLPGFVNFKDAGYDRGVITLPLAKQFAVHYLRLGYRGYLSFYRACSDNDKYDNPERLEMNFQPWTGAPYLREESGPQPARLKIELNEKYGKIEKLASVLIFVYL